MGADIRKIVVSVEEIKKEAGRAVEQGNIKVAVAAVIKNPYAGQYVEDLSPLYDLGAEVAGLLTSRAQSILGENASKISAYGKGAIVGLDGEIEHAAALIHPKFGAPVRSAIGGGKAIIPSTKKVAGAGSAIAMPLVNRDDIWIFDDMDSVEISIADAPKSDEVVIGLAFAVGGRPLKRIKAV